MTSEAVIPASDPDLTTRRREELASSVSHGIGLAGAAVAVPLLIVASIRQDNGAAIVGASVFGATMLVLYLSSTIYHALPESRAKQAFRSIDHAAIFLLIAGTYTPFTLGVLGGAWGWTLFGIVWGMAVVGVTLKAARGVRYPTLSLGLYLAMGWVVIVALKPVFLRVPAWGVFWLLAGGLAYTIGAAFYAASRVRYNHLVWHVFVMVGTTCHFVAVLRYAN